MKRNRSQGGRMRSPPSRSMIVKVVLTIIGISAALYLVMYLSRLEFFRVTEVVVRDGGVVLQEPHNDFRYLVGRNIFSLNLKKEARRIQRMHPNYRTARLIRYLPDRLCVDILKRTPVACIKGRRTLYLDDRSTLFEATLQSVPRDLPQITGIERAISFDQVGSKCMLPEVTYALTAIREARTRLAPYTPALIDVGNLDSLSMVLSNGLQVKLGKEELAEKMQLVGNLLQQVRTSLPTIDYIDVRFKEPVIKFKQND